jgi:hypothetical protein
MTKGYDLPLHVAQAVQRETEGLKVHWVGRPDAALAFRWATLIWLFGVPWTVFAVGWELMACAVLFSSASDRMPTLMRTGFQIVFPLWGLPFIAIGLAMLAAPFWIAQTTRNQAHVVTDHKLYTIVAQRSGDLKVTWALISTIQRMERTEKPDGSGSLKIVTGRARDSDGDMVETTQDWIGIPDVRQVETVIAGLQR